LGFTDFVRVGSLRRIDRKILPHSLHVTASVSSPSPGGPGKGDGAGSGPGGGFHDADASPVLGKNGRPLRGKGLDHARELRSMLRDATSVAEKTLLTRELNETQAGKADQRARLLGKCRVVGTTAASCGNDSLNGAQFSIVVLDESSQMTELGSVCAIVKFGVRALLAVGDPKQLPPVVGDSGTGGGKQVGGNTTAAPKNSLRECLFTRLQLAGHVPTLLRTQYRCHPALARVPNESFYGGELLNGVTEPQRERLLLARVVENLGDDGAKRRRNETPMPPLVWMDLTLTDLSWDSGRSAYSKREARLAAAIATRAVGLGVCPSRVGVIALFKAQASLIQRELDEICANSQQHTQQDMRDMSSGPDDTPSLYAETHRIQVSTVDAFQGHEKEFVVLSRTCRISQIPPTLFAHTRLTLFLYNHSLRRRRARFFDGRTSERSADPGAAALGGVGGLARLVPSRPRGLAIMPGVRPEISVRVRAPQLAGVGNGDHGEADGVARRG
jgi:hypothetical protein